MVAFLVWIGWPLLLGLMLIAVSAHSVLALVRQRSRLSYALAGGLVGVVVGSAMIGVAFKQPLRGALCGVPVGVLCGLLFRFIRQGPRGDWGEGPPSPLSP